MTKAIRKLCSLLLIAVMLMSLVMPALPVISASAATEATVTEPASDLRIGVLSDIHISYDYVDEVYGNVTGYFNGVQPSRFEKALRFYKSQGVDAVVIAGDLQEASGTDAANLDKQKDWLQTVVDIWFKVFPEEKGEEGYVEPIFIYGNHDSALVSNQYWPEELGTYEDAFLKEVNGYSFVCTHNAKEYLAAPLLEKVAAYNQDKPIFYIQHCPVAYTVPGDYGYGVGYGVNGWDNVAPYHNAVVLNGHTHVPLTDERSIWQGDAGNEGQFTVLNTATINYSGLNNDGMTQNSYNGNAQQTEHGLLIDVNGSELTVDRYSFNDMTIDTATGTVSGNAVKLGETWQWDACDITDRPYAYDSRYENANAPEFGAGASVTISSITDTSVKVVIPAASIEAPSGFSDLIEGYVVEACNPTSGEVEATGRVATSYHVDGLDDAFEDTYTVTVSGLKAGTNYTLKVYAQEFFDKRSEPLTVDITTTGAISSYRRGDVNLDGNIDQADMNALKIAVSAYDKTGYAASADIDLNGILEERDITELQAILNATRVTYPESTDLMDLVHQVKLTGVSTSANYQPVDYGTTIQNQVVRGDSNQAVKTWTTNYAYYPKTTMYFSEPVDLSGYSHLSFDTLFENENNLSDSYRKRWMSVSLISGNQEQVASYGSMNFDPNGDGWTTTTIVLSNLKNIDLTAVTGIRFEHNFDYYAGRFDGVTEHAIYWDNIYGSLIDSAEKDLLGSATITGGQFTSAAGSTNNTSQAITSTGGSLEVSFQDPVQLSEYAGFYVDIRTPVTTTVTVQAVDADGNLMGNPVQVNSYSIYQNQFISIAGFGISGDAYASGLKFTYSCESLLLDNMTMKGAKDSDLIGTAGAIAPVGDGVSGTIVLDGANNSNNALYIHAASAANGGAVVTLSAPIDATDTPYLRFDLKLKNADSGYIVTLYNSSGAEIWKSDKLTASASNGQYATYEIDMSSCADLSDVAKIGVSFDLSADGAAWIDNMKVCNPIIDFFGASTSLLGPSSVQDGFICEIMPVTADGRTNVLHWFSDPNNGSGTTSAWPGDTTVTITKDVLFANHSGYDTSDLDYFEFTMKNTGNYVAFNFSFKDASGAELGSSNGEYRVSLEENWCTYRIDLASAGLTPDEIAKIHTISFGWNWQYQNVNGSEAKKIADIYIDNMGFCAYPEDTTDKLDQIGLIRNSEWWWGGHNTYPEAGWLYQSDVTVDSDKAFMFYRGANTNGMGYSPRILYAYFNEPIAVESDWVIGLDVINQNFAKSSRVEIIGSDNKAYTCFSFSGSGEYSLETAVSALVTSDGVAFDPATVSIKGLKYHTNYNRDTSVSTTEGGYLVLDNLTIQAPEVIPVIDLDGYELIDNATSVELNVPTLVESNFVFEVLDTFEGRTNVVHLYGDPANGGGVTAKGTYIGMILKLSDEVIFNGENADFIEFSLKNTKIYCDSTYVTIYDAAGNKLAESYVRNATSNDWSDYRIDLTKLGLTQEEIATIATINFRMNWSNQWIDHATPVAGEVYVDDLRFGSYVDESVDLFDHIANFNNTEWWWSGNNYYDNAGWQFNMDASGSTYYEIYRVKDKTSTSTGYSPRRQYLYFDTPITLAPNDVVRIDATNTNMGTGTKISLIGDDGNKYGYLMLNQSGAMTYEIAVSDIMLLNADTTMTVSTTPIDVTSVKIIGAIFHDDFFKGDATQDGSIVMDNFFIGEPEPPVNSMEDHLHDSPGVVRPASGIESGYVIELMDSYDGYENVLHVNSDPNNGGGTTTNWPAQPGYYVAAPADIYTDSDYDYYEFTFKGTGHYSDISVTFYDEAGTSLGSVSGFRMSHKDSDWMTFRVDVTTAGLTADEIKLVRKVVFGFNWQYQNVSGTALLEADLYFANCGFGSNDEQSDDLIDQIHLIRNSDYWYGGYNNYPGCGWYFNDNGAYVIYRSAETNGLGYNPRTNYHYFKTPVSLESDWIISMDVVNTNFREGSYVDLIGSNNKTYKLGTIGTSDTYKLEVAVSDLVDADGNAFDPATTNIIGLKFNIQYNRNANVDSTLGGTLVFDNLTITDPSVEPEPTEPEPTEPEPTEPETTIVDNGDLLYAASFAYNTAHWGDETGLTYAKDTENLYGEESVQSWSFKATADASNGSAVAQLMLDKAYDFTNCYLAFDAKYVSDSTVAQNVGVRLHKSSWGNHNDVNVNVSMTAGDWNTYVLDFKNVLLSSADTTDLKLISFYFNFSANAGSERAVYIDNVRLLKKEIVAEDWINMSVDGGMSENVTYKVVTDKTYGDSTFAMKVDTGDGYRVTFNTQTAASNGSLPAKVNMTGGGLIGGYFYFGDQEPNVKVRLTDKNWNGGASMTLNSIDAGDGWYYCYLDASNFYFYEGATNPTKEEIIRVSVILPSNTTVYIDQFSYPTYIPAELVDYRIVYDADGIRAVASDVKQRLENDLSWVTDMVPDTVDAVSNEIVLGDAARTNATVAEYLTGGSKELDEFGYAIVVEDGKIYLAANSNAGVYQALDKLVELATNGDIADGIYLKDAHNTTDAADLAEDAEIRVMSYNLLYSTEYLVEDRIGNFLNIIGYYKPDVVGLQETSSGSNAGWHEYIHDSLIRDGIYQKACKDSDSISGLMTTFIYNPDTVRLVDEYVIDLEEGSQIRVLAVAVFEQISNGQKFIVTNTHPAPYGSGNYAPNLQAMLTAASSELEKYAGLPVIMVGDFNTEEDNAEYQTIMDTLNVVDTKYSADTMVRAYNTWSGFGVAPVEGSAYCIDHVFVNKYVDAKLYNVVIDHDVENTSDHIPLYADLKITGIEPQVGDDDMLHGATAADTLGFFSGDPYYYDAASDFVNGDESVTSYMLGTTYAEGESGDRWPTALVCFDQVYDITDKNLVFDVYFDQPEGASPIKSLSVSLFNSGWSQVTEQLGEINYADGWHRIVIDPTEVLKDDCDLTAVRFIKFHAAFYGTEGDHKIYIDNMHLVSRGTPNLTTERASDLLAYSRVEWNPAEWGGPNKTIDLYNKDVHGENSWKSLKMEGTSGSTNVQLHLVNSFDLTGKDLAFDVKFVNAKQTIGLILYNGWTAVNSTAISKSGTGSDGWQTIVISADEIASATGGAAINNIQLITFYVDFTSDAADEHAIIIDNMRAITSGSEDSGDVETPTEPEVTEPEITEPEVTEPEVTDPVEDIDLFDRVTNANLTKQSDLTNGSASAWALKPTATGWSYPSFVFDSSIDISKYELVMDIYPANMTHFRMHLATINDDWGAGEASAVYYGVNKWSTVKTNLTANGAGYTEMTKFSLGIDFAAESDDYALYFDNVRLVERKVNADATEETEKASDMLSIASYVWSATDWTGSVNYGYDNQSDETNGKDSTRAWKFYTKTGGGYARMQISLGQAYDMTNKNLVFDLKFDPVGELQPMNFGFFLQNSNWQSIMPDGNYKEITVTVAGEGWHTVRIDNSILRANVLDGYDLTSVSFLNGCFSFPAGHACTMYIDNMHLEDHTTCDDATDAASDLLVNATIVENSADDSVYFYEHRNTAVSFGENSNASHKFSATSAGNAYHTVKYDLGKSYDLTGKNIVMDVLSFHNATTFLFQLYDSNNTLITSAYRGCASRKWTEVTPAILSNDLNLTDIRYITIGAYFPADTGLEYRAFYVDNVRIEEIDTYHTDLENKNIVFIGDSITASGGYKGWSGELEEHYFINRYNIGAGGTSYATITGRGRIYSQVANIPTNVNVDYFVLNGGVNDNWSNWDFGSVSSVAVENATVDSFDTNTTAGGMEQIFCYLRTNYPNAKIGFVITYNCFDGGFDAVRYRDEFVPLAKQICDKWDIPYLDLVNNDAFNAEFDAMPGVHTYDGVHANDVGYDLVMRQMAPWLLGMTEATEATEQNSDLLAYANKEWSPQTWNEGALTFSNTSAEVFGPYSTRSWAFGSNGTSTTAQMQIKLPAYAIFDLTGKAIQFDIKFDGNMTQRIGMNLYNDSWKDLMNGQVAYVQGSGSNDWQTMTFDASLFEDYLVEDASLDNIYLFKIYLPFSATTGVTQNIYIDNFRCVDIHNVATEESEAASDLLYGAKYISGNFTNNGFGYDQYNTTFVSSQDSKYSFRMYADTEATAWCNARFELPKVLDLTNKSLVFDVNQYQHVYIGVAVYDINNELVASDGFTLRNSGWQTFEVNLLGGLAEGKTAADLAQIKYINFSSSFEYSKIGRLLLVDNVHVYENEQFDTVLKGLNGLYLGDSISEAISYKGWAGELTEHYGVNSYNVSASGAVVINNQSHNLHQQLAKAPTDVDYDFIMLNGGVNDVWSGHTLGEVSAEGTTEFNVDTTIGALEDLFVTLKTNYPDAEIFFVLNYVCVQNGYPSDTFRNEFAPLARAACEKWDVHCLDLVDNDAFNAEFDATANVHTYDGVHANTAGYNVITKYIVPWLENVFNKVEASEETEKASDLVASATLGTGSFTAARAFLSYDKQCTEEVYGDQSLYSLKLAYDGTENDNHDSWPYIWINFGKDVDFTGKKLVFDIKIVCDVASQSISVRQLLNSGWSAISSTTKSASVTAGEWTTVEFNMTDFTVNAGYSLENVNLFGIQMAFTKGVAETIYIDNVRLVDAA